MPSDEELLEESNEWAETIRVLIDELQTLVSMIESIEARGFDTGAEEAVRHASLSEARDSVDRALEAFTARRQHIRIILLKAWLDWGGSITDYAEHFGFTQDYARTLAAKAGKN